MLLAIAHGPNAPVEFAVAGADEKKMNELLPVAPRFVPVKFNVLPALRSRLANVKVSALNDPLPPGVAVIEFAPCAEVKAPNVSEELFKARPVTAIEPPRKAIGAVSPIRFVRSV